MSKNGNKIFFSSHNKAVDIEPGMTVLEAARRAGLHLEGPCDGKGSCGKCRVIVEKSKQQFHPKEIELLNAAEKKQGVRLACRLNAAGGMKVAIPAAEVSEVKILPLFEVASPKLNPAIPKIPGDLYFGAAIDIGTTGLETALIDLNSGKEVAVVAAVNPQTVFGHDVLTRISYATEHPGGTEELQAAVIAGINRMIAKLAKIAGVAISQIYEIVVAGNTAMSHIFAGVNPAPLGVSPYEPVFKSSLSLKAADLGLKVSSAAQVFLFPGISGYVGGDIVAGLTAVDFHHKKHPAIFIDVGTNGEIVAIAEGDMASVSTAAGPAFEGMNITHGCRACLGAIERVSLSDGGKFDIEVIGSCSVRGICGSGLVDLVACLVKSNVVTARGSFSESNDHSQVKRVIADKGNKAFLVAQDNGGRVVLTQKDVRQVQLAKGAIRSGINVLLKELELKTMDIAEVLIAGNFGYHLNPDSLARIGLIPPDWRDRVIFVGNTSRLGAQLALIDKDYRLKAQAISEAVTSIELSNYPGFDKEFISALKFATD